MLALAATTVNNTATGQYMSNPEIFKGPENDPNKEIMQKFCEDFKHAVNLATQLKERYSEELERAATTAAVALYHQSFQAQLPYPLRVTVGEGINAHSSQHNVPIEDGLTTFVATDLRRIDSEEVVFRDFPHGLWYVVFGHDMEIEPVFEN